MTASSLASSSAIANALAALGADQLGTTQETLLKQLVVLSAAGATSSEQSSGAPTNHAIQTSDGSVFTIAAGERGFIQNLDTDALAVKYGPDASPTSFSFILKAGAAADDGQGGAVTIDDWIGVVSVAAMTGAPRFISWKVS